MSRTSISHWFSEADGEVAVGVGHEVSGPGLQLFAGGILGLLGADAGSLDLDQLRLGRHALDLVVDGAAFVCQPLDCNPVLAEPLLSKLVSFPVELF